MHWRRTTFDGRRPLTEDDLWRKTTFDGRRPLTQDNLQRKTTFDKRRPLAEDDLLLKTIIRRKTTFSGIRALPHTPHHIPLCGIFYSAEEYTPLCELILMNLFKWTIIISVRLHCKDFYSFEEYTALWESTLRIFFNWRIFTCVWVNFRRIYTPVRVHFNVIFLMKNIHPCASPF